MITFCQQLLNPVLHHFNGFWMTQRSHIITSRIIVALQNFEWKPIFQLAQWITSWLISTRHRQDVKNRLQGPDASTRHVLQSDNEHRTWEQQRNRANFDHSWMIKWSRLSSFTWYVSQNIYQCTYNDDQQSS